MPFSDAVERIVATLVRRRVDLDGNPDDRAAVLPGNTVESLPGRVRGIRAHRSRPPA